MTMDVNGLRHVGSKSPSTLPQKERRIYARNPIRRTRHMAGAVQDSAHGITKLLQCFNLLLDGANTLA